MIKKLEIDWELAERLDSPHSYVRNLAREELRALLAATHQHEWDINDEGTATVCHCGTRSSDDPATQHQGDGE